MSETAGTGLTREKILDAAEEVLRRYGPSKATVIDVARALGVSHGSVYRHFAGKAELRDAVVEIWLARMNASLEAIAAEDAPAAERLHRWLRELSQLKRRRHSDDPELFAAYGELALEARVVIEEHVDYLAGQISSLLRQGAARGEWEVKDPASSGRAVLAATALFHNPIHASEWAHPEIDVLFENVWEIVLSGLKSSKNKQ